MGNYSIVIEEVAKMLNSDVIVPPPITKKTLDLGSKHSPEFVCVPFKYNLGNFIESLDGGADVIIQAGGGCRFGYYGEVQREILKDLGYSFEFYNLSEFKNFFSFYPSFKKINPKLNIYKFLKHSFIAYFKMNAMDSLDDCIRKNIGFEINKGEFEKNQKLFLTDLKKADTALSVFLNKRKYRKIFKSIKVKKPKNLLKVGVVGELYVVMEPFSNYFMEKQLADKGIEVHRFITASYLLFGKTKHHKKELLMWAKPYLKYHIGADGTDSVAMANKLRKEGFDGIIHLKPFGCIPEVNAMSALQRLSKEKKFPIIYFSFDSHTSETGIKTRLEAFYDMLKMRKDKKTIQPS